VIDDIVDPQILSASSVKTFLRPAKPSLSRHAEREHRRYVEQAASTTTWPYTAWSRRAAFAVQEWR